MSQQIEKAREAVREFALGLPGAHEEFPWGERVVKVKGKIFAFLGHPRENAEELALGVKLPKSGTRVLDRPYAEPSGYGLGKSGWVSLRISGTDRPAIEDLHAWIEESYRAIAPKKLVAELDGPRPAATKAPKATKKRKR